MNAFFFGMGYSSLATARAIHTLIDGAAPIAGTTRTEEGVERLAESPYRLHVFDGVAAGATLGPDLRQATHVILSIPPNDSGDPALWRRLIDALDKALATEEHMDAATAAARGRVAPAPQRYPRATARRAVPAPGSDRQRWSPR